MNTINVLGYLACVYFGALFSYSLWVRLSLPKELLVLSFYLPIKWWALFAAIAGGVIGVMA